MGPKATRSRRRAASWSSSTSGTPPSCRHMAGASGRCPGRCRPGQPHLRTPRPRGRPMPGVVARTELLGVARSRRVDGVPSGSAWSGRIPPPTYLTAAPTLPALHRNLATEPRSTGSEASGPGGLLPRGRTRTGLEVETTPGPRGRWSPMARARIRAHPTTDLPRNDSGAGAVTIEQANAPVAGGPAGRGVRASDLNGPGVLPAGAVRQARNSKSAWRPSAVTAAHRLCQVLHTPWRSNGGQEASPI
jgi:hypothetical protein